jgi:hypothetical protein
MDEIETLEFGILIHFTIEGDQYKSKKSEV